MSEKRKSLGDLIFDRGGLIEKTLSVVSLGYLARPSIEVTNRSIFMEQEELAARARRDKELSRIADVAETKRETLQEYAGNLSSAQFEEQYGGLNKQNYANAKLAANARANVSGQIFQPNRFLEEADTIHNLREQIREEDRKRAEAEEAHRIAEGRANRDWNDILNGE